MLLADYLPLPAKRAKQSAEDRMKAGRFSSMMARSRQTASDCMTREDFDRLWLRASGKCELTGIPFSLERIPGCLKRPWSPSVDRKDCSKGYGFDNCRLVCTAVNLALNEFGDKVLLTIAHELAARFTPKEKIRELTEADLVIIRAMQAERRRIKPEWPTHCGLGHEFTPENRIDSCGPPICKTCVRAKGRIMAGWPEDIAFSMPALKPGYRYNRETGAVSKRQSAVYRRAESQLEQRHG